MRRQIATVAADLRAAWRCLWQRMVAHAVDMLAWRCADPLHGGGQGELRKCRALWNKSKASTDVISPPGAASGGICGERGNRSEGVSQSTASPVRFATSPGHRLGMLVPSSNTALEPETAALLQPMADQVGLHVSRFRVTRIALDGAADAQFALDPILNAADLLADAKASVIAWNGTAASWRGFDTDAALCAALEARTGCPATSAIVGLNDALTLFGVRRLGLVTPYTEAVEAAIAANYAAIGIEVVSARRKDLTDNYSFAEIPPRDIYEMCRAVACAQPDAIAIVCTNMRGPAVAPLIEEACNIPVLDSICVTLWAALRRIGLSTAPLTRFGRLFDAA